MIDNKKIEEAARCNADKYRNYPTLSDEDRNKVSICSFMEGTKWMQEEFLNNLWHPANEAPNYEEWILTEWYDKDDGCIKYDADYLYCLVYWKDYVRRNNITKWCYIKDIKN